MYYLVNRFRFLVLFVLLVGFCFFKSIGLSELWGRLNELILIFLMILSMLLIGQKERWLMFPTGIVVVIQMIVSLSHNLFSPMMVMLFNNLLGALFFLMMMLVCIYFTFRDETINVTTLFGSLSAYLLLGLTFAYLMNMLEVKAPGSFQNINIANPADAIYFSFVTMTTLGFGDVIPLTMLAKTLTWFEAFIGQCYMALIIGQLIGRYVAEINASKEC
tara:strand:- start:142 stop:795 length:654 start_codon:yes stop_codon:yes gene_type:complete